MTFRFYTIRSEEIISNTYFDSVKKNSNQIGPVLFKIQRTHTTNHGERSRGNGLDDPREILGFFFGTRTSPTGNGASSDGLAYSTLESSFSEAPPVEFAQLKAVHGRWFSQSQFAHNAEHYYYLETNTKRKLQGASASTEQPLIF